MDSRIELDNFYNAGFGWVCKSCEADLKSQQSVSEKETSRLMREGEAESKKPSLSNLALAKWTDITRRSLTCPRCGVIEAIDKF